jgi:murein DD-endopeptidase MepM/ murein hydrolase activator NlpD
MQRAERTRTACALAGLLGGILSTWLAPAAAPAAAPHLVQPGETMWSISAANNFTTRTVAAFNGLPEDALVAEGQTIQVPTVEEGAAALAAAGITPGMPTSAQVASAAPTSAPAPAPGSTYGLGHIPSPWGELHLDPAAADSWNAMRAVALHSYGVDLYPDGPLSAFRTYEQQAYLYDLYLAGQGEPANPPGSSTHELGVAVDVAEPVMRDVIDQIGADYGWAGTIPSEWWHVAYLGG